MNKLLTRKKHSKRIAKLALKKGIIDKKFYKELYIEYYTEYKRPKRKSKGGYRITRYFPELHFCTVDYWGEADETSIIDMIEEEIHWATCEFDSKGQIIKHGRTFNNTKSLINYLHSKGNNYARK